MTKKDFSMLGVEFDDYNLDQSLEYITKDLLKNKKKNFIVTPNPEILVIAQEDKKYKDILNSANLALPDGIGIVWASKFLGKRLKARVAGVDLMESLCREVSKQPITVGFLGGGEGIAVKTAECLKKDNPSLKIALAQKEPSEKLKKTPIDILFVAFGSPKQEIWIYDNLKNLKVKVAIGVGGSFDFISGKVPRAPQFIRDSGLEWLFRLLVEPWRAKRQLRLLEFVLLILREKLALLNR